MTKKFQKMAEEVISSLGFIKAETDSLYPWSIATTAGNLTCRHSLVKLSDC